MHVTDAIRNRFSTRAYLDRAVEQEKIEAILEVARFAPSGVNTQPWQVAVLTGAVKQQLGTTLAAMKERGEEHRPDYPYYPESWFPPYKARRVACGKALYAALEIQRDDIEKRKTVWLRNYHFFGAPVGLIFSIDKGLGTGSYIDYGMFLQNVMLAAQAHGLATCPQASLAEYPDVVREVLQLPSEKLIVCGMAIGYPDLEDPVNLYRTEREPVEQFTTWYD